MTGIIDYMRAYYRVARLEYAPGEVPAMLFPILLGAASFGDIFLPRVMEALVVFVLLFLSGFIINSWVDRDLDKKYATFKGGISEGVDVFGDNGMKLLLALHIGIPIALTVHLSVTLSNPWFLVMVLGGAFLGLGYSQPPFHFKVKGWLHAVSLGISAYFIPFLFLYYAVSLTFHPLAILFILCFTVAHYSMEMANQAADAKEDLEEGLLTPAARWGLSRTLGLSRWGTAAGLSMVILMFYVFLVQGLPMMEGGGVAGALSPAMGAGLFGLMALIMLVAYGIPLKGQDDLYRISRLPVDMDRRSRMIKDRINFAGWQASGVTGAVMCLGVLFLLGTALVPVTDEGIAPLVDETYEGMDITGVRYPFTYHHDGSLMSEAEVSVRPAGGADPDDFTIQGTAMSAGRVIDTVNATPGGDWTASLSLRIHDDQDTSFRFVLMGPSGQVGDGWSTPSPDDLYISGAFLDPAGDLLGGDSVVVRVWNDGPEREAGSVKVILLTNRFADTLTDESVEVNGDVVVTGELWEVTFDLDLLESVEDFEVRLEHDGVEVDYHLEDKAGE